MRSLIHISAKLMQNLVLLLLLSSAANAHLMVAQHGTINVVDDGAFMVLSLAISGFKDIDDDKDGEISLIEFNLHRTEVVQAIKKEITLQDAKGSCPLEGIMLSPVADHEAPRNTISQLTVMGRFTLAAPTTALTLRIGLYGNHSFEKSLEVSARRKTSVEVIRFSPTSPQGTFFTLN